MSTIKPDRDQVVPEIMKLLDGLSVSYATAALNEALRLLPNTSVVTASSADQAPKDQGPQ